MSLLTVNLVNQTLDASAETFDTMMGVPLQRRRDPLSFGPDTRSITSIIGLSGTISFRYVLTTPASVGIRLTGKFLGAEPDAVNDDVLDALKEIVNIIVGAAAAKVPEYEFLLTLPVVLIGQEVNYMELRGESVAIPVFLPECGSAKIGLSAAAVQKKA